MYCYNTRVAKCNTESNSRVGELGPRQAPDSSRLRALKVTSDAPESRLLLFRKVAVFRSFLGFPQPTCYSLPLPLAGPEPSLLSRVNCLFSTQRERLLSSQVAIGVPRNDCQRINFIRIRMFFQPPYFTYNLMAGIFAASVLFSRDRPCASRSRKTIIS